MPVINWERRLLQDAAIIHRLADLAAALSLAELPDLVRRQAALTLLDTVGCMIAGSATQEARSMLEAESEVSGNVTVMGSARRLPIRAAARVNAYMGDIFEINDLTGGHAGIGNVAAALAAAEASGSSGEELLVALVAGIEVTTRIYSVLYPSLKPYSECGMVPVGVPSAIGAAACAARLFGLDRSQTREALAIAAALAGWCPAEVIFGKGSTVKPMLFGSSPASAGLQAARYAAGGLTGPANILESPIGYFSTVANGFDVDAFAADDWALSRPRRKLHACCGYIHSAIDAIARLYLENPAGVATARSITVAMPAYVIPAVAKADPPRTSNEARFDTRFCIAVAASGAPAILPEHSEQFAKYLAVPAVADAYDRTHIVADPSLGHYHQAVVRIEHFDDSARETRCDAPRGSPDNPLSDEEVIAKFDGLAAPVFGKARSATVRNFLLGVATARNLDPFFAELREPAVMHDDVRIPTAMGV
jgi:2-methylcitrate dehydratase PrpD